MSWARRNWLAVFYTICSLGLVISAFRGDVCLTLGIGVGMILMQLHEIERELRRVGGCPKHDKEKP